MDGEVMEMAVEPGQNVFEGELLARVVSSNLDLERESALTELERAKSRVLSLRAQIDDQRLAMSRARAAAVRAEEDALARRKVFDRQQFLFTESATPRLVYEKSRREYEQAKLESDALEAGTQEADDHLRQLTRDLNAAQKVLDLRSAELDNLSEQAGAGQVLSPVTGFVIDVRAHAGDTITPGMTDMIQLATDLSDLQVDVSLSASAIAWLKPGTPALIEVAESAGEPIDGLVKSINGTDAVVAFTTPNAAIRPGLSALVRLRSH
jgi:multidrug resistance efflux pump